jgi:hypothetical protein
MKYSFKFSLITRIDDEANQWKPRYSCGVALEPICTFFHTGTLWKGQIIDQKTYSEKERVDLENIVSLMKGDIMHGTSREPVARTLPELGTFHFSCLMKAWSWSTFSEFEIQCKQKTFRNLHTFLQSTTFFLIWALMAWKHLYWGFGRLTCVAQHSVHFGAQLTRNWLFHGSCLIVGGNEASARGNPMSGLLWASPIYPYMYE